MVESIALITLPLCTHRSAVRTVRCSVRAAKFTE